jgi:hypothetical protein
LPSNQYHQTTFTPGLWKNDTCPVVFSLAIDDFGVRYVGQEHAQHIIDALEQTFEVYMDWAGSLYCGITLKWVYANDTIDFHARVHHYNTTQIPKYHTKMPTISPHSWTPPIYGQHVKYAVTPDNTPSASPKDITRMHTNVDTLLYNAYAPSTPPSFPPSTHCRQYSTIPHRQKYRQWTTC